MGKKHKLCVLMPTHWARNMGGAEYQVKCLLDSLEVHNDLSITFLARNIDPLFSTDKYDIRRIESCCFLGRYGFIFDWKSLLSALNHLQPDVIYQRVGCAYTGLAAWYAERSGCRLVWHISSDMDVLPKVSTGNRLFGLLEKKFLEYGVLHANYIIAQTKAQDSLLNNHYGRKADLVVPNFHPIPTESLNKSSPIEVVWVANFKPVKRPEIFVRLANELYGKINAKFIMIGRVSRNCPYEELLDEIAHGHAVDYRGELSQAEVNRVLAGAGLLVNTSVFEGFSNTFIQAWLREVPVLSLGIDPDGILESREIGICAGTYEGLRDAVVRLATDENVRRGMGIRARAYACENHSIRNVDKITELLR